MNSDARIDDYIAQAAKFAQPVLRHLRALVHQACPPVQETLKWSMPHFMYEGILCHMAAFQQHCAFGFWKGRLLADARPSRRVAHTKAMGQLGRIQSLTDLPSDKVLLQCIKEAMRLNETKEPSPARRRPKARQQLIVPEDLRALLKKDKRAQDTFAKFSYSHRKEYVEWITEAKRDETRQKRLNTTALWLAQGKPRNWKYAGC
jgi:uncharacterized protein YdeI (YjbR/CyaY-like superfamily)